MQRLAEATRSSIKSFWRQRACPLLILQAADVDMPAVLKVIEALDETESWVWCWVYNQPFVSAAAYVDAIVADVAARRGIVHATLTRRGDPGWAELPPTLTHPAMAPADRLRAASRFMRDVVPRRPGGIGVIGLLPGAIEDKAGYAQLAAALLRHAMPLPWCAGIRFMLREPPGSALLDPARQVTPSLSLRTDFGPAAVQAALKADAADPAVPAPQRATALVIAAAGAAAHGHHEEALASYRGAFAHFGAAADPTMAALSAHGIAGCLEAKGDLPGAERIWVAALDTAFAAKPPALPVVLNVLLGLVMLVARQSRWVEAEAYAIAAALVADVLFMPGVKAEAELRCGVARQRQGKLVEAEAAWRACIATADAAGEHETGIAARRFLRALLDQRRGRQEDARNLAGEIARQQALAQAEHART